MKLYKTGITVEADGLEAERFRSAGYVEVAEVTEVAEREPETAAGTAGEPETEPKAEDGPKPRRK